jgi:hypothetical protein
MSTGPRNKAVVERRVAGDSYSKIAADFGMKLFTVRRACMRAMWRGEVTADEIRYSKSLREKKMLPDAEYNARYLARLDAKSVVAENGCIEVPSVFHNDDGYVILHHRTLGQFAHRIVVILKGRPIPKGFMACHRCGNHGCVNDDHLYVGTMKDNARDTVAMGRHLEANKTECIHGHPFSPENTYVDRKGKRNCRTCQRISARKPEVVAWRREYQNRRRAEKRARRNQESVA